LGINKYTHLAVGFRVSDDKIFEYENGILLRNKLIPSVRDVLNIDNYSYIEEAFYNGAWFGYIGGLKFILSQLGPMLIMALFFATTRTNSLLKKKYL